MPIEFYDLVKKLPKLQTIRLNEKGIIQARKIFKAKVGTGIELSYSKTEEGVDLRNLHEKAHKNLKNGNILPFICLDQEKNNEFKSFGFFAKFNDQLILIDFSEDYKITNSAIGDLFVKKISTDPNPAKNPIDESFLVFELIRDCLRSKRFAHFLASEEDEISFAEIAKEFFNPQGFCIILEEALGQEDLDLEKCHELDAFSYYNSHRLAQKLNPEHFLELDDFNKSLLFKIEFQAKKLFEGDSFFQKFSKDPAMKAKSPQAFQLAQEIEKSRH